FAQWVGEMIPDVKQNILLVTYPGKEEEAITRLSRVGYDNTLGYLEGGFERWKASGKDYETIQRVSAEQFEAKYDQEKTLIFDVRKKSEYDSEHVIGAMNVPLNEINQHLTEFPKDREFVIYCGSGYRSMIASAILKQRGWQNFADVREGFKGISETAVPKSEYVCPTTML
ncbi:MAG: rhodanese-like domain-containing protein, partial [Bacteroidota bacterium]